MEKSSIEKAKIMLDSLSNEEVAKWINGLSIEEARFYRELICEFENNPRIAQALSPDPYKRHNETIKAVSKHYKENYGLDFP
jgi:hypothetical protein